MSGPRDRPECVRPTPRGIVVRNLHPASRFHGTREKRERDLAAAETITGASIGPLGESERDALARFFRGLGDPTRLALLAFLGDGERNVTECVEHVGLSQGRVSAHLACLTRCGFVCVRREGRFAYYSIADTAATDLVIAAWPMVAANLAGISGCRQVANET